MKNNLRGNENLSFVTRLSAGMMAFKVVMERLSVSFPTSIRNRITKLDYVSLKSLRGRIRDFLSVVQNPE